MKKLALLLVMVLGVIPTMWAEISVQTKIFDASSQPMLVGGFIENYSKENVSKKGIIISKRDDDLVITDSTVFDNATIFLQGKTTGRINNPYDIRFIDCTDTNEEQFACALQFLMGNTDYYVKAFVIGKDDNVFYGSTEIVHTQDFNRYNGWADYANVYYYSSYTLFDVVTDEIIDKDKGYYCTTNEHPTTVGKNGFGYKLATEWNYKLWYSQIYHGTLENNSSKVVHLPVMRYADGLLTIEKNPLDIDKDITLYYSINGSYFRPETYTDVYNAPIEITEPCAVYCYAISSEGYISYTNIYAISGEQLKEASKKGYKSLDDYIATSTITKDETQGYDIIINPTIKNVKRIFVDLTKGSTNSAYCYLRIRNNENTKEIHFSSKYLKTSSDNFDLVENNSYKGKYNIKKLADNNTFPFVYYNPKDSNEVIIDVSEYFGCVAYISDWQRNFGTSCIVNIETDDTFGTVADVVDLGLSVKWASWNVGASKVADYGGLYGAGDPTGLQTSTNYNDYYWKDGESICGTEYDLAHVKWGDKWQLPTIEQLKELKEKCTWEHNVTIDGVRGSVATGPNGNQLFIPYAGAIDLSSISYVGKHASLWSGDTGYAGNTVYSHSYIDLDVNLPSGNVRLDGADCFYKQSIRPIYREKLKPIEGDSINYNDELNDSTNLNGTIIGNIYYSISDDNGEYNSTEGCIVLKKGSNDETLNDVEGEDIFGEDFKNAFTGIVFMVQGKGTVKVNAESVGGMTLKVKIGNNEPISMELEGKMKISVPYNVTKPTYVYIYCAENQSANARGFKASSQESAMKIYGLEWSTIKLEGDLNGDFVVDVADIATVISSMAEGNDNSKYDVNGDGVVDVADIATLISIMAE